ncbi:1-(5-phosphoribosyl)-5-[(5-phosphoribosylamino)methylideneamino]imidazole-4-carboxamide isomerase [[Eubacterium] cellulosolvens]
MYAAIDLIRGGVVRLRKGRASDVKLYPGDPVALAQSWSRTGIGGLHVVDLDGAFGQGNNLDVIRRIIQSAETPVQVGGGVRTAKVAGELIEAGADSLVVGTVALTDETTFGRIVEIATLPRIIVALDYQGDVVLVEGWRRLSGMKLDDALNRLMRAGLRSFLLTSSERDGMMDGPDVDTIRRVCQRCGEAKVFASGGVRSATDVATLRDAGAYAVIIGKALLEGTLPISEAIQAGAG